MKEDIKEDIKEDDYFIYHEENPCQEFWCDLANLLIPIIITVGIVLIIIRSL